MPMLKFSLNKLVVTFEWNHNKFTNDCMKGLTSKDSTNKLVVLRATVPITRHAIIAASEKMAAAKEA